MSSEDENSSVAGDTKEETDTSEEKTEISEEKTEISNLELNAEMDPIKYNNSVLLYNYTKNGMSVLAYGYSICEFPQNVELTGSDITVPIYGWRVTSRGMRNLDMVKRRTKKLKLCILSQGIHLVYHTYNDMKYGIEIKVQLDEFLQGQDNQAFRINIIWLKVFNCEDSNGKIYNYLDCDENTHNVLVDFIETAKKNIDEMFDSIDTDEKVTKRLIYSDGFWQKMNIVHARSIHNIFLPENTKEKIIKFINEFLDEDNHSDYIKYGKPYKCNVLFHGLPGTGKTSLINAIAGEIDSDIGILSFNHKTDDQTLTEALRSFVDQDFDWEKKCRILVIEDIDCMFDGRKKDSDTHSPITFSGILNCLDGMCRMEGLIIFMTANDITKLDKALIRPGRVDYKLKFDYSDEYQMKTMFETFFGTDQEDTFEKFSKKFKNKEFTTACLHQFFFQYRKSVDEMMKNIGEFSELIKNNVELGNGENMYN